MSYVLRAASNVIVTSGQVSTTNSLGSIRRRPGLTRHCQRQHQGVKFKFTADCSFNRALRKETKGSSIANTKKATH